jgi:hypothetical protein
MGLEHRGDVGRAVPRPASQPARFLLAPDSVRQARHGIVRPGSARPAADARAADGRRSRRHGRGRLGASSPVRIVGGRTDECALRGDLPAQNARARHARDLRKAALEPRLPVGADGGGAGRGDREDRAKLGRRDGHLGPGPERRRGVQASCSRLHAPECEPGRGGRAPPDEHPGRRAGRAADDPRSDAHPPACRRPRR